MDLDDELRQLFTSDRLDVPVRADAEDIIVSGARRLRRRRIAAATASGALAVVVVVTAGIALAGGDPDAMPPATTNPSTPPAATSSQITTLPSTSAAAGAPMTMTTTTTTPPPPSTKTRTSKPAPPDLDYPEIGPGGFQSLKLGQTLEEARATGLVGDSSSEAEDTCESYPLLSDDVSGRVYITDTVQAIVADPVMTPEGVGPGWTVEQVSEVYSEAGRLGVSSDGRAIVPVPGNSSVVYVLKFADGVVTSVSLAFADQSCY